MTSLPTAILAATRREAGPLPGCRRVLIRDWVLRCSIGVHAHEERAKQRIRVNLALDVAEATGAFEDRLANVVCYDEIIQAVRRVVDVGHVRLIETLAERVAALCLVDRRVRLVSVQIEKLDVYDDVGSVGVAIERMNDTPYSA